MAETLRPLLPSWRRAHAYSLRAASNVLMKASAFPGLPGAEWNIQYGYGRPSVYNAMRSVHEGNVPPEANITAPEWYEVNSKTSGGLATRAHAAWTANAVAS